MAQDPRQQEQAKQWSQIVGKAWADGDLDRAAGGVNTTSSGVVNCSRGQRPRVSA